jgi:nicotinamidase-related amidase
MNRKALVVIDIQNDITKHYRDIIENINSAIDWAIKQGMTIIYIKHNNLSAGTRTFKPGTKGAELVPELKIVSDHIFVKTKANALTSEAFSEFIRSKEIREFYITGPDATGCVKSTCFNMTKAGYAVHVISDCVTSYDLKKKPEMLAYYDCCFLDWVLLANVKRIRLPGTEEMDRAYHQKKYHVIHSLIGMALGLFPCLACGWIVAAVS